MWVFIRMGGRRKKRGSPARDARRPGSRWTDLTTIFSLVFMLYHIDPPFPAVCRAASICIWRGGYLRACGRAGLLKPCRPSPALTAPPPGVPYDPHEYENVLRSPPAHPPSGLGLSVRPYFPLNPFPSTVWIATPRAGPAPRAVACWTLHAHKSLDGYLHSA